MSMRSPGTESGVLRQEAGTYKLHCMFQSEKFVGVLGNDAVDRLNSNAEDDATALLNAKQ